MGRVLADTGLHMRMATAVVAITLGHIDLQSASLVVANQLRDGIKHKIETPNKVCCTWFSSKTIKVLNLQILISRYHVPRSWLKPTQNLLVLFEELGGNPSGISLVKRSVTSVCADVAEYHPTLKKWHIESYGKPEEFHSPKAHLRCSPGHTISSIKFASFGTPSGTCGTYQQGPCHATTSYDILQRVIAVSIMCKKNYNKYILSHSF